MNASDVIRIGRKRSSRSLECGLDERHAFLAIQLSRELDDQDRVLGGEPDQRDETDLAVDVERDAAQP